MRNNTKKNGYQDKKARMSQNRDKALDFVMQKVVISKCLAFILNKMHTRLAVNKSTVTFHQCVLLVLLLLRLFRMHLLLGARAYCHWHLLPLSFLSMFSSFFSEIFCWHLFSCSFCIPFQKRNATKCLAKGCFPALIFVHPSFSVVCIYL